MPTRTLIRIDYRRLDYELARRGLDYRGLAERSGLNAVTLSRARHGRGVTLATLNAIAAAIAAVPEIPGANLVAAPNGLTEVGA